MKKTELLAAVGAKKGFVRIVSDKETSDNIPNNPVRKMQLVVEHTNTDGTAGITNVFYLHNTNNDEAKFYNQEPEAFDNNEPSAELKKLKVLENYINANFIGGFVVRSNLGENYAEADVYEAGVGRKTVLIYKPDGQPITHIDA